MPKLKPATTFLSTLRKQAIQKGYLLVKKRGKTVKPRKRKFGKG